MPADRDQTKSRKFVVIAGVAMLALVLLAGAFIVLNPLNRGGKTVRPGEESGSRNGLSADDEDADGGSSSAPRASASGSAVKSSGTKVDPAAAGTNGGNSRGESAKPGDEGEIANIDLEEINGPVKGYLIIRVTDKSDDRPLPGASVYFPMRETELENEGGDVKLKPGMAETVKRTNKFGIVVWKDKELNLIPGRLSGDPPVATGMSRVASSSVVVTAPGYADLFETVTVPAPDPKGTEIALKLSSAVRVSGKARLKRGGAAANVKVEVKQSSRQGAQGATPANAFSFTTDSLGEFQLKVANDYLYQFIVKSSGYAPYQSQIFDFKRDERTISIILDKAQGIEGIVTDKAGKGIAGATVASLNENMSIETDAEGKFVFDLVKDRIYSNDVALRVSAKGYAPQSKTVLANDREVKVQLLKEGTLTGVVVNEKDEPVNPAQVTCRYFEGKQELSTRTVDVGADGAFAFDAFGSGVAILTAHTAEGLASNPQNVNVAPETEAGPIKLKLTVAASVTGVVTAKGGGPLVNVTIALDGKNVTATNAEGQFTLAGMDPGKHNLKIVNQFPINDDQVRQLPVFTTDGKAFYYLPAPRDLNLKFGAAETVNFECEPFEAKYDRKITIRVVTVPAETANGVAVTVTPVYGKPPAGIEMPKPYSFNLDIPEGRFESQVQLLNGVSYEITFIHARYFTATLSRQSLDAIKDGETIEVQLERAFMIKGYVRDSEGNGLEGVGLSKDKNNKWNQTTQTDTHGYFEFGQLREGEYTISAFKTSYYLEQKDVKIEGHDPDPLELQLVGANEIRIIVTNNGQPQPGAHVHAYRNENDSSNPDDWKQHFDIGTTDAQGVKFINFHWQRNYQVVALYGSQIGYVNFDNLKEQPSREFTLALEAGYPLSGTVLDTLTGTPVPDSFVRAHIEPTGVSGKDGNLFQTQADANGNFALTVPAGMFHFYVPKSPMYKALDTTGNPVPNGTTGVSLMLEIRPDIQGNYAQLISFSTPANMTAGEDYEVSVTMKNAGSTTWTSAGDKPWRLGSQNPQDNNTWNITRVVITAGTEVRPGENYTFTFTVKAPANAGQHNMQWRMVQDGVQWFGQFTNNQVITVAAAGGG
jgi:hypothetical protein